MGERLDHETLTEMGKRAVACVQAGETPSEVSAMGVNLRTVFRWLDLYRADSHRLDQGVVRFFAG